MMQSDTLMKYFAAESREIALARKATGVVLSSPILVGGYE